ncbi:MAG: AAA domain-containing protein, partial [Nitrospinaceae bacterium]|nr:AAA domain-containing protein [Nitrospinaceae bacterium]NIR53630.1 AAA domain-containing protein [Nitrospinaceae bacterium]NIS84036.1 AAA domain-containing protein [Nitrospinaceae bacterium]NIT80837.1 AAA domain-containing protein [Nitrospinaceae bacterium]NIU43146.1 AAA domain-containing protein [Nitrospinaceae bacterium]
LKKTHSFRNIIGKSSLMKDLFQAIQNIAAFDTTVLIQGESGTGKELVARAIHYESPRSRGRLITVNCSVFSEHLLESELFGHVQGAFTGAVRHRVGQIEEGHGGTIFLDEIGDLTPQVQIKLLRVLQEKEIQRVGENATRKVNIRIIAASNKNLLKEVREGRFREDLYYRLNVIPIHLPPLRMRKEDIPGLARHFIQTWRENQHKWVAGLSDAALSRLLDHDWPGNVRELENAIEYACVKCTGTLIRPGDLPEFTPPAPARFPVRKPRRKVTPDMVRQALAEADHNQTRAAKLLNLHRTTLWRKMKTLGIDR